jgi:hypothetical protein
LRGAQLEGTVYKMSWCPESLIEVQASGWYRNSQFLFGTCACKGMGPTITLRVRQDLMRKFCKSDGADQLSKLGQETFTI